MLDRRSFFLLNLIFDMTGAVNISVDLDYALIFNMVFGIWYFDKTFHKK